MSGEPTTNARFAATRNEDTGIIVIGRNEGDRLRVCLESALPQANHVIYVDSGSTDGSAALADGLGAEVVALDTTIPFTAARARNAGFERLEALDGKSAFVQFVDGDCELDASWIDRARSEFEAGENVAVVCGRRAERFPEATIYNRLCDMEWDTPVGEAHECGGDALMDAVVFRAVGGFSDDLIAGEEPELCSRIRAQGGRVLRIDAPMTLHDAMMDSFSQWWMRNVRAGHANAEGAARHEAEGGPRASRETRSTIIWGMALPAAIVATLLFVGVVPGLLLSCLYDVQIARIALRRPKPNFSTLDQWLYAASCVIGKIPNVQGQIRFWRNRRSGNQSTIIEYKGPDAAVSSPESSASRGGRS
ncbi:MAG: glycosyltransferase family 2 protein [Myxococcota bacterium]